MKALLTLRSAGCQLDHGDAVVSAERLRVQSPGSAGTFLRGVCWLLFGFSSYRPHSKHRRVYLYNVR